MVYPRLQGKVYPINDMPHSCSARNEYHVVGYIHLKIQTPLVSAKLELQLKTPSKFSLDCNLNFLSPDGYIHPPTCRINI